MQVLFFKYHGPWNNTQWSLTYTEKYECKINPQNMLYVLGANYSSWSQPS